MWKSLILLRSNTIYLLQPQNCRPKEIQRDTGCCYQDVVRRLSDGFNTLRIPSTLKKAHCPQCNRRRGSGGPFSLNCAEGDEQAEETQRMPALAAKTRVETKNRRRRKHLIFNKRLTMYENVLKSFILLLFSLLSSCDDTVCSLLGDEDAQP